MTYQPRGKEDIDQIGALVRSAIGFDQKRGDQVEVVNMRFAETPANPIDEPTGWLSAFHFTKDDIMRAIEMVVMGLLGFVVLLMVVRPLVRRVLAPEVRALAMLPPGTPSPVSYTHLQMSQITSITNSNSGSLSSLSSSISNLNTNISNLTKSL